MKKILIGLLCVVCGTGVSFAISIQDQCKQLTQETKGTKLEALAQSICVQLTKPANNTSKTAKSPSKLIKKKKIIGSLPERTQTSISKEQVQSIIASSVIKGNTKARFLILEYSDLQCPFCKKHRDNKTIESLIKKYNGRVAATFRHLPLSFHEHALSGAYALECVAILDQMHYYDYIGEIFGRGLSQESDLYKAADTLGLDTKKLKDCVPTHTIANRVHKQIQEAVDLFAIGGTPGNVILDTVTGKYKVIMGAYPASEFEKVLDVIVK